MSRQRAEFFSNGPSNVTGKPDKFTTPGDIPKLYGRAWSGLMRRSAFITFGVVIAMRLITGTSNQGGFLQGNPRAWCKTHSHPSFIQTATSQSVSCPSLGL